MVTREVELQPRVGDYRRVLRKHRWLITGIFLLAVLTVAIWTFVQVPIYQAVATILIEPEPPRVLNIQDVTPVGAMSPYDPAFYPTQYEIIKSRAVVERAVAAARQGYVVTFGIAPGSPETGYGYIQRGAPLSHGVDQVKRFEAAAYSGSHLARIFASVPSSSIWSIQMLM